MRETPLPRLDVNKLIKEYREAEEKFNRVRFLSDKAEVKKNAIKHLRYCRTAIDEYIKQQDL